MVQKSRLQQVGSHREFFRFQMDPAGNPVNHKRRGEIRFGVRLFAAR